MGIEVNLMGHFTEQGTQTMESAYMVARDIASSAASTYDLDNLRSYWKKKKTQKLEFENSEQKVNCLHERHVWGSSR